MGLEKAELNQKVLQYQRTRKEEPFLDVYRQIKNELDPYVHSTAKQLNTEPNEIFSLIHETMLRTVNQYSGQHDFENFFKSSYKNARRDFIRKKQNQERHEYLCANVLREDQGTYRAFSVEDQEQSLGVIRMEQRKILKSLLEKTEDVTTLAIVEAFPSYDSITALGKALGLHHETVKRKLRRLARYYDKKKFGRIEDYWS